MFQEWITKKVMVGGVAMQNQEVPPATRLISDSPTAPPLFRDLCVTMNTPPKWAGLWTRYMVSSHQSPLLLGLLDVPAAQNDSPLSKQNGKDRERVCVRKLRTALREIQSRPITASKGTILLKA